MNLDKIYKKLKNQTLEIVKMKKGFRSHPLSQLSKGYSENNLTAVTLSGVVTPWRQKLISGAISDYKLVSHSGLEYFIVADSEWREVLSTFCWQEVNVIGLLNVSNMTLIPQKVFPKGPESENVIDLAAWKSKEFIQKLIKNVKNKKVIPAAVSAVECA
ncbi:MAG: hypothetical protein ACXVAX_06190 [Pseudobdellovibrio sp.]